ncbi:PLP-dependent aminotransferase family protein [Lentibacillus halophilus]
MAIDKYKGQQYIYQNIYNEFKRMILDGRFKADEKLPSKRKLAEQLDVGINTITNSYEQLLAEGYIYTQERKGYFVEAITQFAGSGMEEYAFPEDLKEAPLANGNWLSFSHMTADVSAFPFSAWMKCGQKAIANHKQELSEIPHPQGPYQVRESIARMIALSRGVICEPEQIVVGAGSQLLVRQLMEMQSQQTTAAVEDPGYSRFYTLLRRMGINVNTVPIDNNGADVNGLEEKDIRFLFITPSHQFPTGNIMPISRRIEWLNWSARHPHRYIVEDDYDSEFKYETDHIPSLQSLDKHQRVIYIGTFSKTILPGMRISYMVLPPEILRAYQNYHIDAMQSSNILELYTLHYFIESGEYTKHLKRMNHYYEKKRKCLIQELKQRFESNVTIDDIPAGLHFLARFQTSKTYDMVEKKAKEEKLEIYTIRRFTLERTLEMDNIVILTLGFATIQEEEIPEAVDRLYRVIYA